MHQVAVEEYRFEVNLANQRFQWYVGLNVAVTTVAAGLLRIGDDDGRGISAVAFGAGIVVAAFTWLLTAKQAIYYRNAREQVKKIEAELGVADIGLKTTGGFGGSDDARLPQVRTINYLLLGCLALLDGAGIVYVAAF